MKEPSASIIPAMKYRDAKSAIDWLYRAFGFKRHLVVEGENNSIAHAQLTYGNSMIMLGSASDDQYGRLIKTPQSLDGYNTQAPYIIEENIDEHYKHGMILIVISHLFWT